LIILKKFQNIPSLDKLTTALSEADKASYCDILRAINFSPKELSKYSSWSEDYYTRNCILNCDKFELILICWCKSHKTPIHDHGGEECWVKVISGQLEEVIYEKNENDELTVLRTLVSKKKSSYLYERFYGGSQFRKHFR
jgi:cysteine dioxygenase